MENYKEKYEAVIERAKKELEAYTSQDCEGAKQIVRIFPELKESEDERIRKAIIEFFQLQEDNTTYSFISKKDILAWLEKQGNKTIVTPQWMIDFLDEHRRHFGTPMDYDERKEVDEKLLCIKEWLEKPGEQKSIWSEENNCYFDDICEILINLINSPKSNVNKDAVQKDLNWLMSIKESQSKPTRSVESKFKVGDWVVLEDSLSTYKIVEVCKSWYEVISNNDGMQYSISFDEENDCRLWTIKEAKDGDVLVAKIDEEPNDFIYIFKEYSQNLGFWSHCYLDAHINKFHKGIYHNNYNVGVPATKKQRDLLFQKMQEAGYEWDVEEKKLKLAKS